MALPGGTYADYVERMRPPDVGWHPASTPATVHPVVRRRTSVRPQDTLARLLGMLPNPNSYGSVLTDAQIRAKAQADSMGILGPLLDRENSDYAARLAQGSQAVKDYTGFFADRLGAIPGQVQGMYDRQQGLVGSIGDALSTGQGKANQPGIDSLGKALEAMGAPNAGATVAQQGELSAGGTRLTKNLSATELQRVINEGTAQESFAAQQPGIAALQGGQTLRDYLGQINNQRASNIADINGQAPSLAQSLFASYYGSNSDIRSNRNAAQSAKASLAASWLGSEADRKQNAAIFQITQADKELAESHRYEAAMANAKTSAEKVRLTAEHNHIMATIAQQNADSRTTTAAAATTRAAKSGNPKPITWQTVVQDAKTSANSFGTSGGLFGGKTKPPWQAAYLQLANYLRTKYPKLTPAQIKQATEAGLAGAGYGPNPAIKGPPAPGTTAPTTTPTSGGTRPK